MTRNQTRPIMMPKWQWFDDRLGFFIEDRLLKQSFPLHWHDYYEIELVVYGRGHHHINGISHEISAGEVTLLTPVDFHSYSIEPGGGLYIVNISFSEKLLSEHTLSQIMSGPTPRRHQYNAPQMELAILELTRMWEAYNTNAPAHVLGSFLEAMCVDIIRQSAGNAVVSGDSSEVPADVLSALTYIRANFGHKLMLEEVAQEVHLSPNYLSAKLKKFLGVSFSDYVTNLRLEVAKTLLEATSGSVSEIAMQTGFESLSHFSYSFRKKYSLTPSAYREGMSGAKKDHWRV